MMADFLKNNLLSDVQIKTFGIFDLIKVSEFALHTVPRYGKGMWQKRNP
ncbi:hypothetical protein [Alteromonas sediminis]|nr:hypothetical protein [Alteromonas sediminis]